MPTITEGQATITVPAKTSTKKAPAFYNPHVALQRNINIAFLRSIPDKNLRVADVLAGTGVRAIRFLLELPKSKIKRLDINDANPTATKHATKNLAQNNVNATVHTTEASQFLHETTGFNYIEIDPFGSPAPFLDAACQKIVTPGIISLAATDTAALSGSAIAACIRKYWARPLKNEFMHETGMRILIRKAQMVGAQYEKAIIPVYCHSTRHYLRAYFRVTKNNESIKEIIRQTGYIHYCFRCLTRTTECHNSAKNCCGAPMTVAGPLWLGPLWDENLAPDIANNAAAYGKDEERLTQLIADESRIPAAGFYSSHHYAKKHKIKLPKQQAILDALRKAGYAASLTHFSETGIRTNAPANAFLKTIKNLSKQ